MVLKTLDMGRRWNGLNIIQKHILVTCKANEAYDFKWGTQIGRIQYKPTDKKVLIIQKFQDFLI